MAITVSRGGQQSDFTERMKYADPSLFFIPNNGLISISFSTGGLHRGSYFRIFIDANSFKDVAAAMIKAAPGEAVRAFGAALENYSPSESAAE